MLSSSRSFFFSSRRRHTRSYGDWSSDVCSSDLKAKSDLGWEPQIAFDHGLRDLISWAERSEERRVGKECRSGWAPDHGKKKEDGVGGLRVWRAKGDREHESAQGSATHMPQAPSR